MPKPKNPKPPYPAAFRQQMVELVAAGRRPSELAKEFGCHETSVLAWVRIARAATPSLSSQPPTLHESERLASRKVVGWAFGARQTADLVLSALNMALFTRKPESVIHHSDQGSQYSSIAFGQRCKAMAESFFATLECELIDRRAWKTHTEARLAIKTKPAEAGFSGLASQLF